MSKSLNSLEAQKAYCQLLKIIENTNINSSQFPGPGWNSVYIKLTEALLEAEEVLNSHGIELENILCE
jgi:hypothetical protein